MLVKEIEEATLPHCPHIQQICGDFLKSLTATGFTFHRIYSDGTRIYFSDSVPWLQHFIKKNHFKISGFKKFLNLPKFTLWAHWPKEDTLFHAFMQDARETFDCANTLNIVQHKGDYLDSFAFRADKDNTNINNIFMNEKENIQWFTDLFLQKITPLISEAETKKIRINENTIYMNSQLLENSSSSQNQIVYKRDQILIDPSSKKPYLTQRQTDCLVNKSRCMSNKKIARKLNITHRTVEQHFENIKNRTGLKEISDLFDRILPFEHNRDLLWKRR